MCFCHRKTAPDVVLEARRLRSRSHDLDAMFYINVAQVHSIFSYEHVLLEFGYSEDGLYSLHQVRNIQRDIPRHLLNSNRVTHIESIDE